MICQNLVQPNFYNIKTIAKSQFHKRIPSYYFLFHMINLEWTIPGMIVGKFTRKKCVLPHSFQWNKRLDNVKSWNEHFCGIAPKGDTGVADHFELNLCFWTGSAMRGSKVTEHTQNAHDTVCIDSEIGRNLRELSYFWGFCLKWLVGWLLLLFVSSVDIAIWGPIQVFRLKLGYIAWDCW